MITPRCGGSAACCLNAWPPTPSHPPFSQSAALLLQGEACTELDAQLKDVGRRLIKAETDLAAAASRLKASEAALAQATARVAALEGEAKVSGLRGALARRR